MLGGLFTIGAPVFRPIYPSPVPSSSPGVSRCEPADCAGGSPREFDSPAPLQSLAVRIADSEESRSAGLSQPVPVLAPPLPKPESLRDSQGLWLVAEMRLHVLGDVAAAFPSVARGCLLKNEAGGHR